MAVFTDPEPRPLHPLLVPVKSDVDTSMPSDVPDLALPPIRRLMLLRAKRMNLVEIIHERQYELDLAVSMHRSEAPTIKAERDEWIAQLRAVDVKCAETEAELIEGTGLTSATEQAGA